jgi:hypothetical protein
MRVFASILVVSLLSVHSSQASVLTEFDFSGEPGGQASTAPSFIASGLAVSEFRRGAGLEVFAGAGLMNSRAWTLGEVEPNLDYYEFVISPGIGVSLDLNEIAFAERRSATGIRAFTLRSSLDGYLSDVISPIEVPDDAAMRDHRLTLGAAFDAITGPITFRMYGYFSEAFTGRWGIANHSELGAFRVSGVATGAASPSTDDLHAPEPTGMVIWGSVLVLGSTAAILRECGATAVLDGLRRGTRKSGDKISKYCRIRQSEL